MVSTRKGTTSILLHRKLHNHIYVKLPEINLDSELTQRISLLKKIMELLYFMISRHPLQHLLFKKIGKWLLFTVTSKCLWMVGGEGMSAILFFLSARLHCTAISLYWDIPSRSNPIILSNERGPKSTKCYLSFHQIHMRQILY